jgi:pimeloyl-ACP methyl ester carboxylesterase
VDHIGMNDPADAALPWFQRTSGGRPFRFICLPGLVPDGVETYTRQRAVMRRHGEIAILTYPYRTFELDLVIAAVRNEIATAVAAGLAPVLVGLSIGGGIVIEALRRARDDGSPLPIEGLILVSPMTCTADLSPMLTRLVGPIIAESDRCDGNPGVPLERGRALFKTLVVRATGQEPVAPWRGLLGLLTPQGFAAWHERRLAARIQATLERIPAAGAIARVRALRELRGLDGLIGPLCEAPSLILWGSKERQTLDMDGPGAGRLCRPDLAHRVLPDLEVQWVYDRDGGEVPHASLLKHAASFNAHLVRWLRRLAAQQRTARRVQRTTIAASVV